MLKKLAGILFAGLLFSSPSFATDHYFENGRPDSTEPCTLADKCDNMRATTLDNTGAIACGDTVNLERGSSWEGSEAEYILSSGTTACSSNPIYVQARPGSTGANPTLYGAAVTSTGWSLETAPGIYVQSAAQSQTHLKTVVYNSTDSTPENYKGLFYWSGSTTTLPAGSFKRSSTTLRVRLWADEDPSTSNVRIASFAHTPDQNGSRGLLSGGRRTSGSTYGNYLRFRDINIIGANGDGYGMSGIHTWDANLLIIGAGQDGWRAYADYTVSQEKGEYYRSYGTTVKYSAAGANGGGGSGQGFTTYSPYGWWVYSRSILNNMAGYDWLNFGPSTVVAESGCLWCYSSDNGSSPSNPSFDAGYYIDGGYRIFIGFSRGHRSGIGVGNAGNARTGALGGSEHPTTDPTYEIYFVGNWFDTTFWVAAGADNSTSSTANLKYFYFVYNTIIAYRSGGQSWCLQRNDWDTSLADSYVIKNNILYAENSGAVNTNWASGSTLDTVDSDGNQIYKEGGSDTAWRVDSSNISLAAWRTASGEDTNSAFGDPLFVDDNESGGFDVTLQGGSPAIDRGVVNAYTVPAWLPTALKNYLGTAGIRGSTIASGTEDNYDTAPDAGYHKAYPDLTSTDLQPASLIAGTSGTMAVTFTVPDPMGYIPYNGKIEITLGAGYTLNSGGTSAFTSSQINGTWNACSVAGQVITCTRAGDGNSEFPQDFVGALTFVGNGAAGSTGTGSIRILDSSNNVIIQDTSIEADVLLSGDTGAHFQCNGLTNIKELRVIG